MSRPSSSLLSIVLLSGFIGTNSWANPWAESLNEEYGTALQEIEITSLPEQHYLRRSFSAGNYRLFSEVAPRDQILHGGFIVVSENDNRVLASGRFQQGMFHGPFNIYENKNSRVVLDYQFGRLTQSRQIDEKGNEQSRDFSLPPQPQAIYVKSKSVNSDEKINPKDRAFMREIAASAFNKPHSRNVEKILASFEKRLAGTAPVTDEVATKTPAAEPEPIAVHDQMSETDFVSSLTTQFSLTTRLSSGELGSSAWISPDLPREDVPGEVLPNINQREPEAATP